MQLLLWSLVFILAVVATVIAAELFNEKADELGDQSHASPFWRGVIISTFLVALPELTISIFATSQGYSSMVPTYVTGANLINLLLIPGLLAVSCGVLRAQKESIFRQIPMLFASIILLLLLSFDGEVSRWEGVTLLIAFGIFAFARYAEYKQGLWERLEHLLDLARPNRSGFSLVLWLIILVVGAYFTVRGLTTISEIKDVNPGYLASTLVALAVSAPEIIFAYRSTKKGNGDAALNVLISSTIVNSTLVMAIPALIKPLDVLNDTVTIGNIFLLVAIILFSLSMFQKKWSSYEGAFLILLYFIYLIQFLNPLFS